MACEVEREPWAANGPSSVPELPIAIELRPVQGEQQPLDTSAEWRVRVINVSDRPIWIVGVLPGSEGLRYPRYLVEIEGPSGPIAIQFPEDLDYGRGLQPEDFVRLAPGESFDPQRGRRFVPIQSLAWFKPSEPGKYRLRLRLDMTAQDPRLWLGHTFVRDRERVEQLLRLVPRIEVRSNPVEIEFV